MAFEPSPFDDMSGDEDIMDSNRRHDFRGVANNGLSLAPQDRNPTANPGRFAPNPAHHNPHQVHPRHHGAHYNPVGMNAAAHHHPHRHHPSVTSQQFDTELHHQVVAVNAARDAALRALRSEQSQNMMSPSSGGNPKSITNASNTPTGAGNLSFYSHHRQSPHSRLQQPGPQSAALFSSGSTAPPGAAFNPDLAGMRFHPHPHGPGVANRPPPPPYGTTNGYARSPTTSPDDIRKRAANLQAQQQQVAAAYFHNQYSASNLRGPMQPTHPQQHHQQQQLQHQQHHHQPQQQEQQQRVTAISNTVGPGAGFKYVQEQQPSIHEPNQPIGRPMASSPKGSTSPFNFYHTSSLLAPTGGPKGESERAINEIMAAEKRKKDLQDGLKMESFKKSLLDGVDDKSKKSLNDDHSPGGIDLAAAENSQTYSRLMAEADKDATRKRKEAEEKNEKSKGKGRGRGRGKKTGPKVTSLTAAGPDGTIIPICGPDGEPLISNDENGKPPVWYTGNVPLGLEEDQYWLSELQVYLRSNFAEAFGATDKDIAAPMHGRNKPIALGQVGIRCVWCRDEAPNERGQQAVSYPSLVSGIYNSVQQMFRLHFDCCTAMPPDTRRKIETLRASSSSRGGRKQYWIDSAKRLGLVDTPHGIHFGRDPTGPLPPLAGPSAALITNAKGEEVMPGPYKKAKMETDLDKSLLSQEHAEEMKRQKEDAYPLVLPEDRPLISDYLYLTLEQMEPCKLMDADRVGCYKGREMGFPGLACKWCVGQAGCGRYFPASEASLSQTTTSQTILNHVRNCRRCPVDIRDNLELMKRSKVGPDGKKSEKPKHGGRKVFFHRLWCRIQGLPIDELENIEVKIGRQKGARNKARMIRGKRRGKRKGKEPDDETTSGDEETDDEDSDEMHEEDGDESSIHTDEYADETTRSKKRTLKHSIVEESDEDSSCSDDEGEIKWVPGCIPLNKLDDLHYLSESQCFVRSEMIEAFSVTAEDVESGVYEDAEEGQVGIRCKFSGQLSPDERPKGHCYFPTSVSAIYQCAMDLQRRHFIACDELPDDIRRTFKSLRGFAAKAEGDTQKYWADSARELGLMDSNDGKKVFFFRDPELDSPADEMILERTTSVKVDKKLLVRPGDEDIATDHMIFLLRQVKPCRFRNSDRRVGPGSRGRDRALGFPGVACIHSSKKNSQGKYFPVSSKALGDNTTNSIHSYLLNCSRCPEKVKASLAYLSHRSVIQKVELGGSWKQKYCKKIWDRLHVERAWSKKSNDVENNHQTRVNHVSRDDASAGEINDSGVESDNEALGEMGTLIKAAAIWLCERDADNEALQSIRTTRGAKRKSSVASRRSLPLRYAKEKEKFTSSKRRRGLL